MASRAPRATSNLRSDDAVATLAAYVVVATVLVVDDEHGVTELFDAILTDKGYRVLTAINGKHGLEVLAQEHVNLIFVDFMMPVMGAAVMLHVMMADPLWRRIPVVIMSALPETVVANRCSGYVGFLRKPFQVAQVENLTERLRTRSLIMPAR